MRNEKIMELLRNVPRIEEADIEIQERQDKAGYPYYFLKVLSREGYDHYIERLKESGFQKCMEIGKPGGSYIRNATYKRGELFTSIRYGSKGTRLSYYLDPYYVDVDVDQLFAEIPRMQEYGIVVHEPVSVGGGCYQVEVERTLIEHYQRYIQKLEETGFERHSGNDIEGKVFQNTYIKGSLVVVVIYIRKTNRTYIIACQNLPLSEHLFYKKDYVKGNQVSAQTKLHMLEMWTFGNSFILQLKNGHFIVSDGGTYDEIPYFLDYIEKLVPSGEKPVIEAWLISHAHRDHTEVLQGIGADEELADRLYVEGIYFNEPSDCVMNMQIGGGRAEIQKMKYAAQHLHTTSGSHPHIYRTQTGQRYYFNDVVIDVVLGQEQLKPEKYGKHDINDSSTWLMFYIEGQKLLLGGDGDIGGMDFVMHAYDKSYFEIDVMGSLHHSGNNKNYFTDFCNIKTLLITRGTIIPERKVSEDKYMKASVDEWFSRAEGTRVLTFPYELGGSAVLPHFDWKYHPGQEKPKK